MPPQPQRFPGLDTLRAAAIVAVMLYHNSTGLLPPRLQGIAAVGWAGVDLFFVLSGFLIGAQLLRAPAGNTAAWLRTFYARRAFRTLPAFAVVLLLYALVPLWREAPGPAALWPYATFTWNLVLPGYPHSRAFSHIWSLCVEEQFYLVFPLLLLALRRKPSTWKTAVLVAALIAGGIGLRTWLFYHRVVAIDDDDQGVRLIRYLYYPTYSRLDGLVCGVALAVLRTFRTAWWNRLTRHGNVLFALGTATVAAALRLCGFGYPSPDLPLSGILSFPLLALGFSLLTAAALSTTGIIRRRLPGAAALATLAYSLYLTHKSVAHVMHTLLPAWTADPGWRSLATYTALSLTVAACLYFAVERPFLKLRRTKRANTDADTVARLDPAL